MSYPEDYSASLSYGSRLPENLTKAARPRPPFSRSAYVDRGEAGSKLWIWTRSGRFLSRFSEGIPVLARDFSQSWIDGPRILPSIYASPGQREHEPEWTHFEHPCRSAMLIERTSWNCGE